MGRWSENFVMQFRLHWDAFYHVAYFQLLKLQRRWQRTTVVLIIFTMMTRPVFPVESSWRHTLSILPNLMIFLAKCQCHLRKIDSHPNTSLFRTKVSLKALVWSDFISKILLADMNIGDDQHRERKFWIRSGRWNLFNKYISKLYYFRQVKSNYNHWTMI